MGIDVIYMSSSPENHFEMDAREYFQAIYLRLAVSV
jgi:hypothetical protein